MEGNGPFKMASQVKIACEDVLARIHEHRHIRILEILADKANQHSQATHAWNTLVGKIPLVGHLLTRPELDPNAYSEAFMRAYERMAPKLRAAHPIAEVQSQWMDVEEHANNALVLSQYAEAVSIPLPLAKCMSQMGIYIPDEPPTNPIGFTAILRTRPASS